MILSVAWKEYREHRIVWVFMAVAATILTVMVTQIYPALNIGTQPNDTAMYLLVAAAGSVLTYGVVCGAMLLAGERESSTLTFLDALTGQRLPVWFAKVFPGVVFCLLQGYFVAAVAALAFPADASFAAYGMPALRPVYLFILLPAIALDAFVWGLVASALCSSVLTAAGLAALSWLLAWLLLLPCGAFQIPILPVLGRMVLDLLMLVLSAVAFCQTETAERETTVFAPPRRVRKTPSPSTWRVLLWLPLRQGWMMILVVAIVALFFGLFLPLGGALMWLSCTLLVGVLFGTSAFGNEQSEGSHRFLGNQRLPMGKIWAAKIGFWLAAAVGVALVFILAAVLSSVIFRAKLGPESAGHSVFGILVKPTNWYIFAPLGLLYGFAVGQFYALLWHKSIVAVVMALLVSPGFALLWLPSLVFGGLHFWQVIVPPLVLLAGTRLVMWSWTSTGLALWRPGLTLVSCGIIVLGWTAGSLCYRFWEVPYASEPFDSGAYLAEMPKYSDEKNPGPGPRLAKAGTELKDRLEGLEQQDVAPAAFAGRKSSQEASTFFDRQLARAIDKGWPQDPQLDRWLDRVFEPPAGQQHAWMDTYKEAADFNLGLVEDLQATTLNPNWNTTRRCLEAGTFFEARALQLQAAGREAEALDVLALMLDLSRHLRNYALMQPRSMGQQLENMAVRGLDRWLAQTRSKELLEHALRKLNAHEDQIPPVALSVKAEHVRMRTLLDSGVLVHELVPQGNLETLGTEAQLVPMLWYAPWERQRAYRMLNALTEAGLRAAECSPREAVALLGTPNPRPDDWPEQALAVRCGLTLLPGQSAEARRWGQLLQGNMVASGHQVETLERCVRDAFAMCRLRAARLKTALRLYQADKHKPAPDLEALVQEKYFAAVPLDPFDDQPFRYRVSEGEHLELGVPSSPEEQGFREVVKGQAILWSVGPDGVDDGGKRQGAGDGSPSLPRWMQNHFDYIFIVPAWSEQKP